jgi:murein DD-endopeptidase MepM/ murein hydrolase activator NlpD
MIAAATTVLALGAGVASAQAPAGAEEDYDAIEAAGGGGTGTGGGGGGDGGGGGLSLKLENVSPGKIFYSGTWAAKFRFEIDGSREREVKVEVIDHRDHEVVRDWNRTAEPGVRYGVTWRGSAAGGGAAHLGRYFFRVRERGGKVLSRTEARGDRYVKHFPHKFPVRGRHTYGDGIGAGRGHRGQDVFADCGTELQAARAGRVQWKAYQGSGAGYYIVIDGKSTGKDYVYMHLKKPSPVKEGDRVRTGQRIGKVGESGNATGCHLHFELWSAPGWYEGGRFLNPTKKLKAWDGWS